MSSNPWDAGSGFDLPSNLKPHPPAPTPEAPAIGSAVATASPFTQPVDIDAIIKQLVLDRPLKLFIPNKERFPDWEFRIINSIASEIADAHNKGFREVTDPELTKLFTDLVAGSDKDGKAFRPILCARPRKVGEHIRERNRLQLQSLYAGMNPENKDFGSKYAKKVDRTAGNEGSFTGDGWRIRTAAQTGRKG